MKHEIKCDKYDNCFGTPIGYIGTHEAFLYDVIKDIEYLILED